jgi:hypothetical protein
VDVSTGNDVAEVCDVVSDPGAAGSPGSPCAAGASSAGG